MKQKTTFFILLLSSVFVFSQAPTPDVMVGTINNTLPITIASGDNTAMGNDFPGLPGSDVVFSFTTSADMSLRINRLGGPSGSQLFLLDNIGNEISATTMTSSISGYQDIPVGDYFLILDAPSGNTGTFTIQFQPLIGNFVVNPTTGCAIPHTVFFTDQSTLPDTWFWNFGDGNTSTLQNPVHPYTATGQFDARLTVTDTIIGISHSAPLQQINVAIPIADFTGTGPNFFLGFPGGFFGCGPLTTAFVDASTTNGPSNIIAWNWDFGDGNTSAEQNPVNTYQNPGVFTVSLTITLDNGCIDTQTFPFFVQVIGPDVDFTADVTSGLPPLTVNFQDLTIFGAPIVNWSWDFGDGGTSSLQNPTHTYATPGTFDVSLTVTDIDGCERTLVQEDFITNLFTVTDIVPAQNDFGIAPTADISTIFNAVVNATTVTPDNVLIYGSNGDTFNFSATTTDDEITFDPDDDFLPGELVTTVLTNGIEDNSGTSLAPFLAQFITATSTDSPGRFLPPATIPGGSSNSRDIELGDIDGDGDIDAIVANFNQGNQLLSNNGDGTFIVSTLPGGSSPSTDIGLGDVDNDGDVDITIANFAGVNQLLRNNGDGTFVASNLAGSSRTSTDISLGDIDGDGDLDALVANTNTRNRLLRNDGTGVFIATDISTETNASQAISLGDIDNDGDLDALVANFNQINRLLRNNGDGIFIATNVSADTRGSRDISLGDLDGDGDLDAIVANIGQANRLLRNDGNGSFTITNITANTSASFDSSLGDIDGDGDLDVVIANSNGQANTILRNEGTGNFTAATLSSDINSSFGINMGDIDGDGDLDVLVANNGQVNRLLFNALLRCPENQQVDFDANCEFVLPDYTSLAVIDSGVSPTITQSPFPGTIITTNQTITLIADDGNGNMDECTFEVIPSDTTAPTLSEVADQNESFDANCEFTLIDYTPLTTVIDNCTTTPIVTQDPAVGTVITTSQTVILTATDDAGNTAMTIFEVIPVDNTPPVITCPTDLTVECNTNTDPTTTGVATATDNCDINPVITFSDITVPGIGNNSVITRTWTATDINDNTSSCDQIITIEDSTPPIINCPADLTVECNASTDPADTGNATATDNCDANPIVTFSDMTVAGIGNNATITRTWTVTDVNGNSSSCDQIITLEDSTPPVIECPADLTIECDAATDPTATGMATATDNCDTNPTITFTDVTVAGTGNDFIITRTWTATDANGNAVSCDQLIMAEDNTSPTAVCVAPFILQLDETNQVVITVDNIDNGSFDNCGGALTTSIDMNPMVFDCSNIGENTVTLSVTDANGNTASCTTIVTIEDVTPPVGICVDPFTVLLDINGIANITTEDINVVISDNCGVNGAEIDITQFTCDDLGENLVTMTIFDSVGNTSTCTTIVTVDEIIAPFIDCPINELIVGGDGSGFYTVEDFSTILTVQDNCDDGVIFTQNPPVGTILSDPDIASVVFTATDAAGNISNCSFDIIIDSSLAIEENIFSESDISLYPNPTDGNITIELINSRLHYVELYDIQGRLVRNIPFGNESVHMIDLSSMTDGVYLARIIASDGIAVRRIIKK